MLLKLRNGLARMSVVVAAIGLAGCATGGGSAAPAAGQASAEARPALWQVSDEDTIVYLFGTIHTLPQGTQWRSPRLAEAIAASDELVTEVVVEDPMAAVQTMMRIGRGQDLPPILERVPEERRAALRAAIEASGLPMAHYDALDTWAASLTLVSVSFARLGFNPALGVEPALTQDFVARQRPRRGLETFEEQFGFFDAMPESEQREFLLGALESEAEMRSELAAMVEAWRSGDVNALDRTFNDADLSPRLRDVLLTRRNAGWADWIHNRMAQPGTVFLAVGAGHFAGEDSVRELLKRRGFRVRRVQ
jgi:uncharacterized protein YbaP (TraB family)